MPKRKFLTRKQFECDPEDSAGVALLESTRCRFGLTPRGRVYCVSGPLADSDVDALFRLSNLIWVSLTGPWNGQEFTDAGFQRLMLHPKLQIFGCADRDRITDSSAAALAISGRVRYLCLNGCKITNQGVEYISGQTQLLQLNLKNTKITTDCIPALCKLTNLRLLTLIGTDIDESSRTELLANLPRCKALLI